MRLWRSVMSATSVTERIVNIQDADVKLFQPLEDGALEEFQARAVEEYHRLKRRDRDVLSLDDFTEADLEAIRTAKPAEGSAEFDPEVE
jgi:hypothetical protein